MEQFFYLPSRDIYSQKEVRKEMKSLMKKFEIIKLKKEKSILEYQEQIKKKQMITKKLPMILISMLGYLSKK